MTRGIHVKEQPNVTVQTENTITGKDVKHSN